jgi:hypothetical protein
MSEDGSDGDWVKCPRTLLIWSLQGVEGFLKGSRVRV